MTEDKDILPDDDEFDNAITEPTDDELVDIEATLISEFLINEDDETNFTIIGHA
jgi:hypothetical protein